MLRIRFKVIADEVIGLYVAVAGSPGVRFDFFAPVINENSQMANVVRISRTPQRFEERHVGNRSSLVQHQMPQKLEFLGRQVNGAVVHHHSPA